MSANSFTMAPKATFTAPQAGEFPHGIQWQINGVDLGGPDVETVNIVGDTGAVTRLLDTLTLTMPPAPAAAIPALQVDGFAARRSPTQQNISGVASTILFDSTSAGGCFPSVSGDLTYDTGTGIATVVTAGIFRFIAYVQVALQSAEPFGDHVTTVRMLLNNDATRPLAFNQMAQNIDFNSFQFAALLDSGFLSLQAGDTVRVTAVHVVGDTSTPYVEAGDANGGGSRFNGLYYGAAPAG